MKKIKRDAFVATKRKWLLKQIIKELKKIHSAK